MKLRVVLNVSNLFPFRFLLALFTDLRSNILVTTKITCLNCLIITHIVLLITMRRIIDKLYFAKFS